MENVKCLETYLAEGLTFTRYK